MIPVPGSAPARTRTGAFAHPGRAAANGTRAGHRRALQALLVLLGAVLLLLAESTGAFAHAELQVTTPANGAVLDRAPATVTVAFTDVVQVGSDGVRVLAADGTRVDRADAARSPGNPRTVTATLRSGLPDGTYTVAWRVASADAHPVHGAFAFTVGAPGSSTGPLTEADQETDQLVSALVLLSRGTGYAGLALLIGAAGILALGANGIDVGEPGLGDRLDHRLLGNEAGVEPFESIKCIREVDQIVLALRQRGQRPRSGPSGRAAAPR